MYPSHKSVGTCVLFIIVNVLLPNPLDVKSGLVPSAFGISFRYIPTYGSGLPAAANADDALSDTSFGNLTTYRASSISTSVTPPATP